ncbi:MAG: zinc-binding dehydrogenase, partial [Anaerolineae bacterium]|nr:zinc-binding dehydrogenase [Anaerolineae bacterium]
TLVRQKLTPDGKSFTLYGTSSYFLGNRRPYEQDWATLFHLLETRQIAPVIMRRFPILEAAKANELLESGTVVGNVVLVAPELLNGDASSS